MCASRPRPHRPAVTWVACGFSACCAGRRPDLSVTASRIRASSSGRICPKLNSRRESPPTTWSAWPYATRTTACSARSRWTTSSITRCPRTGERQEPEMARIPLRLGERADLSVPRGTPQMGARYDADAFGKFSEGIARFLGTGRFLFWQTMLVIAWIVLNTVGLIKHWDPYPFILLNLAFSTQAAYAAPLILLAQNRQDDRDRANIDRHREGAARAPADAAFLARELSAVRLALADVFTPQDLEGSLSQLGKLITAQPSPDARAPLTSPAPELPREARLSVRRHDQAGLVGGDDEVDPVPGAQLGQ